MQPATGTSVSTNTRRRNIGTATPFRNAAHATEEVLCSSDIQQNIDEARQYRVHPLVRLNMADPRWHEHECACYHCCEPCEDIGIRIPQSVDACDIFTVWPIVFCSLACAKAHLMEQSAFNTSLQMALLHRVARDVYGWTETFIPTAPPRLCLRKFGGDLTLDEFRAASGNVRSCRVVAPPFVPLQIVMESAVAAEAAQTDKLPLADEEPADDDLPEDSQFGKTAINTWKLTGLRRPDKPLRLPRAEPATPGTSMLETYVASVQAGKDWASEYGADAEGAEADPDRWKHRPSKLPSSKEIEKAGLTPFDVRKQQSRQLPQAENGIKPKSRPQNRRTKRKNSRMPSKHDDGAQGNLMSFVQ